jgi:predicted O-methyltransferase YrrM
VNSWTARIRHALGELVFIKCFRILESCGLHVTRVHYYSPIPDTRELSDVVWARESELPGLELNIGMQLEFLANVFPKFRDEYVASAQDKVALTAMDALILYCMVRHFRPKLVVEVGSGESTSVLSLATTRNGCGDIICIDPYSQEKIGRLPRVAEVISRRVQDIDWRLFQQLDDGDLLFIDTSHTVKCGGDVNYLCLEVLPRLHKGVLIHFHDIFFPREYPRQWVMGRYRFWNEQYLLQALLMFSSGFEILFMTSYMASKHRREVEQAFPNSPDLGGGSCWIRRK